MDAFLEDKSPRLANSWAELQVSVNCDVYPDIYGASHIQLAPVYLWAEFKVVTNLSFVLPKFSQHCPKMVDVTADTALKSWIWWEE